MKTIDINKAKQHFDQFIEQAAKGDSFIITKAGEPLVKVVSIVQKNKPHIQRTGFLVGQFTVPKCFDQIESDQIELLFNNLI